MGDGIPGSFQGERRQQHDLRGIFDKAYEIALPYLDPAQGVGGVPLTRYMYIALREAFPYLTQQEVVLLATPLRRAYQERNKPKAG